MHRAQPVLAGLAPLLLSAAVALVLLPGSPASGQAGCQPDWLPTFGGAVGVNGSVADLAVYDDGSGPALYVCGSFKSAGGVAANRIARWDGHAWSSVGGGVGWVGLGGLADVSALAVFDDGSGPALYAGGDFNQAGGVSAGNIARWNGTSWSAVGSGIPGKVYELAVHDDGSGPALYAAGSFTKAGGLPASNIARWNGTSWSALGSGIGELGSVVYALASFDDGGGAALYAGGSFTMAGGVTALRIAKWNGLSWSALGVGIWEESVYTSVRALAAFDDGGGPALYAGGIFDHAGGIPASNIARWSGTSWSALGQGTNDTIATLSVFDDGTGTALYAAGLFKAAGAAAANSIARWNGASWSTLGSGMDAFDSVSALAAYDDGSGLALYAGGNFADAGGVDANHVARWSGTSWSALGGGLHDSVAALAGFDDGSGPALYAGGYFKTAGGVAASCIAKWNGLSWSPLGSGMAGAFYIFPHVEELVVFDDGGGPSLYAGGDFTSAGGVPAGSIAKWDGATWSALGSGMEKPVSSLTVFDDGGGPALYAGSTNTVKKWDGVSWSEVGSVSGRVMSLTVFDDGTGPALYAAVIVDVPNGGYVARWNGATWSVLGGEMNHYVRGLAVFDDGTGAALYACGAFTTAGGVPANRIARWNGTSWSALGEGLNEEAAVLLVHDDGSGPALYAGGNFLVAGDVRVDGIAKWDGLAWSPLGEGIEGFMHHPAVGELASFDDGGGAALYLGGGFTATPGGDGFIATWGCPPIEGIPGCAGNPATLSALASGAPLGAPLPLRVTGSAAATGLGLVYFGAPGFDAAGCGLIAPGIGELLLAPSPVLVASGSLAGGICDLAPPVPSQPSLSGVTAHLQGAAVDLALANPIEPTNALAVTLGP